MIKQRNQTKTSSTTGELSEFYEVRGVIHYDGWLPKTTAVRSHPSVDETYIVGTLGDSVDQTRWSIQPHLALANLPTFDTQGTMNMAAVPIYGAKGTKITAVSLLRLDIKAIEKFVRNYGVLREEDIQYLDRGAADDAFRQDGMRLTRPEEVEDIPLDSKDYAIFREQISDFAAAQNLLRLAWQGNSAVIDIDLETELWDGFELRRFLIVQNFYARSRRGEVLLETQDLWKFVCFLFLHDYARFSTGVCENPECLAPYFLKKRRTQKICELGPCKAYANRKYALKWWHINGPQKRKAKRRQAKRTKQKGKSI